MPHPLEAEYGLTAEELLEALDRRFRAKVALEGAVAEVHMEKKIQQAKERGLIEKYQVHDEDGRPDFTLWVTGASTPFRAECKNVRDAEEAYREGGEIVAYKVETQKTRASKGDPSSRFYGVDQFEILGVCLGKKTKRWTDFMFVLVKRLPRHARYRNKLQVMHRVPLPGAKDTTPWFDDLGHLLESIVRGTR